jgi:hypothetical protein
MLYLEGLGRLLMGLLCRRFIIARVASAAYEF